VIRHVEPVMGTVFSIVADDGTGIPAAVARLHELDAKFSTYRPESVVSRMAAGAVVDYDAEVAEVLDRCAEVAEQTAGWFTAYPEGRLDPSGWVKGWAVAEVARILAEAGAANYCVAGGGDVQTAGHNADGDAWRVGVADPRHPGGVVAVLAGCGIAVATSGVAERGAHIIDPHSGTVAEGFLSVTLVGTETDVDVDVDVDVDADADAGTGTDSGPGIALTDAWATAVFAMGPTLGLAWAERQPGIEALAVLPDGSTRQTPGLGAYLSVL
jgi:thiamine biosynthesis lipoprotein